MMIAGFAALAGNAIIVMARDIQMLILIPVMFAVVQVFVLIAREQAGLISIKEQQWLG